MFWPESRTARELASVIRVYARELAPFASGGPSGTPQAGGLYWGCTPDPAFLFSIFTGGPLAPRPLSRLRFRKLKLAFTPQAGGPYVTYVHFAIRFRYRSSS